MSELPCSVIIVGVGNEQFLGMQELDGDGGRLQSNGRAAVRDIVQFVALSDAMRKGDLAQQVLKEVPEQFCSYMERVGIKP